MNHQQDTLVLDASVLINILATGFARDILEALPEKCLVPERVAAEVRRDPRDRQNTSPLGPYVDGELLTMVGLAGQPLVTFISLVSGPLEEALDDGEASTLAIAHHGGYAAAIDENKARNLAGRHFPALRCVRTVDLLQRDEIVATLAKDRYVEAIASALEFGRMQVPPEQQAWVCHLVGEDSAGRFPSLRKRATESILTTRARCREAE